MTTNVHTRIGMVGYGRIAKKHFQAITSLEERGIKLVSIAELLPQKIDEEARGHSIFITSDYLSRDFTDNIDLAIILTESGAHYENAMHLLDRGVDLVIEKPVTLRLDHAYELSVRAKKLNRNVYVVKQNRYNDVVQHCNSLITKGFLGRLNIGSVRLRWCRDQHYYDQATWRGTWLHDGGVLSNQAVHHIDLLQMYMGKVVSVAAFDGTFGVDIETDDSICAIIRFESGAIGTVEATTSVRPLNIEGSVSLVGSKGTIDLGGVAVNELKYVQCCEQSQMPLFRSESSNSTDVYGSGHKKLYDDIIRHRLGEENSVVTIDEALKSLEIIHMIHKSIEESRVVYFNETEIASSRLGIKSNVWK